MRLPPGLAVLALKGQVMLQRKKGMWIVMGRKPDKAELAAQLRANLARRKAQARARRQQDIANAKEREKTGLSADAPCSEPDADGEEPAR